jgi:hypothetical protein
VSFAPPSTEAAVVIDAPIAALDDARAQAIGARVVHARAALVAACFRDARARDPSAGTRARASLAIIVDEGVARLTEVDFPLSPSPFFAVCARRALTDAEEAFPDEERAQGRAELELVIAGDTIDVR